MAKRIGIIDFDTSHAYQFAARLNHRGIGEDQWVDGAEIVVGCPGKSIIYPERIPQELAQIKKLELPIVETPEEMLKYNLDAVFIESNCGQQHLERAEFFLSHKLPVFVDKPFACSRKDAVRMFELADQAGVPLMSSSSLRYAPEIVAYKKKMERSETPCVAAITYGPAEQNPLNPGFFHYGIHAVEMLYALLGAGCESIACVSGKSGDMATGVWEDGRIGSVRGDRPDRGYGFVAFSQRAEHFTVSTQYIYRELLKAIIQMLETGKSPIDPKETIELVTFIENAKASADNHGLTRPLPQ
ncbi:Gfo/Idh/MocA family oxidoreductase [bacterium]|nr:Gfo/Idh/MocA family oxidoreductase [bacterium]